MRRLAALLLVFLLFCGCAAPAGPVQPGADALTVRFLDVGQADCALLECSGKFMLIDGGNVEDSSKVVSFLEQQGVEELELVVCTHAHEDHVGGLPGVLAVFPTKQVWSPTKTYSSNCFDDFLYYTDQQGLSVTIPQPGTEFALADAQVTVLGPVTSYAETNNTSLVLLVQFGENRFLFTGDMEKDGETDLLDAGVTVKADVLKVGHHGSDTSSGYRFLYEVDPQYAVISVGAGNSYGHPHEEPLSRLSDAGVAVYRTDKLGTITCVSDGSTVAFSWESAANAPDTQESTQAECYIGNKNSHALHLPSCSSLPAEQNRVIFGSLEDGLEAGYNPCSRCMG